MTRNNRPRGRGDDRRPRTTSTRDAYRASASNYEAVADGLPRTQQTNAFLVAAQVLDRLAESIEVSAGQRHQRTKE